MTGGQTGAFTPINPPRRGELICRRAHSTRRDDRQGGGVWKFGELNSAVSGRSLHRETGDDDSGEGCEHFQRAVLLVKRTPI